MRGKYTFNEANKHVSIHSTPFHDLTCSSSGNAALTPACTQLEGDRAGHRANIKTLTTLVHLSETTRGAGRVASLAGALPGIKNQQTAQMCHRTAQMSCQRPAVTVTSQTQRQQAAARTPASWRATAVTTQTLLLLLLLVAMMMRSVTCAGAWEPVCAA